MRGGQGRKYAQQQREQHALVTISLLINVSCCEWFQVDQQFKSYIIESVDSICRDSADTQYMLIQTNFSKSPK